MSDTPLAKDEAQVEELMQFIFDYADQFHESMRADGGIGFADGIVVKLKSDIVREHLRELIKQCNDAHETIQQLQLMYQRREPTIKCEHQEPWTCAARLADMSRRVEDADSKLQRYKDAAPLCEEHKPSGGARSSCLVCACIKLSSALSRISYACEEPNEKEVSAYDLHYDPELVVEQVQKAVKR